MLDQIVSMFVSWAALVVAALASVGTTGIKKLMGDHKEDNPWKFLLHASPYLIAMVASMVLPILPDALVETVEAQASGVVDKHLGYAAWGFVVGGGADLLYMKVRKLLR